jgi:ubiquinone/menaquinone biosynthesis C-methylase UbiE
MDRISKSQPHPRRGQYDANYGNFQTDLYEQIRREAFGEDIGQNSWLMADQQDRFLPSLELCSGKKVLDVGCGAGGPALRMAATTGCSVVGIDLHEQAISTARTLTAQRGLSLLADFQVVNAAAKLPFPDSAFDAITCIDAINHFPDRPSVIAEWARLLKPSGRLLFTDATTVTGPLTNTEIAVRGYSGFYLFVPLGYDERVIAQCGLRLLSTENLTRNMAEVAERRRVARESRSSSLREIEGDQTYEQQQEFLRTAALIAKEERLSRFLYVCEKLT